MYTHIYPGHCTQVLMYTHTHLCIHTHTLMYTHTHLCHCTQVLMYTYTHIYTNWFRCWICIHVSRVTHVFIYLGPCRQVHIYTYPCICPNRRVLLCCSVLQCVAVCCSVVQCCYALIDAITESAFIPVESRYTCVHISKSLRTHSIFCIYIYIYMEICVTWLLDICVSWLIYICGYIYHCILCMHICMWIYVWRDK